MPLSSFYEIHSVRFRPRVSGVLSSDASTVGLSFTHSHGMINLWLHLILYFWGGFVLFSATATYQVLLSTILLYFYWCFLEFSPEIGSLQRTWLHIGSYSLKVLVSCAWLLALMDVSYAAEDTTWITLTGSSVVFKTGYSEPYVVAKCYWLASSPSWKLPQCSVSQSFRILNRWPKMLLTFSRHWDVDVAYALGL